MAEQSKYNPAYLFKVTIGDMQNKLDNYLLDLDSDIAKMRATGMTDQAIFDSMMYDLENNAGIYGVFKGSTERLMDEMIVQVSQTERASSLPWDQPYFWNLDPNVEEHCPDCLTRSEMPARNLDEWQLLGIPGSGTTQCGDYCMCALDAEKA